MATDTISPGQITDSGYEAHRLTVAVNAPYDDFRRRYEQAVPAFDAGAFDEQVVSVADRLRGRAVR